jgi:PKD repeat protein
MRLTNKGFILSALLILLALYSHAQSDPDQIPGLEMWLKADSGIVLNGNYVSEWNDQSGNGHHATSPFDVIRPVLQPQSLNNLPAVSFDGVDDFLSYSDVNNLRTAFWVMRESPDASGLPLRPLLGYSAGLPFMRGPGEEIYDPSFSASEVRNGITRLNFQPINGITTVMPVTYSILSVVTTGPVAVNTLTMELGIYGRTWWGEMAEVIIYNTALTGEEVLQVETYLAEKYGPSFLAMEDVSVPYGFCETTLCSSPGFLSYQWQDGPQTQCRTVSTPGDYIVTLTDTFGRVIHDTVSVNYPGNVHPGNVTICSGETYTWDTQLEDAEYNFLWDDNSTGSFREITTGGSYWVTITDDNACSTTGSIEVTVDNFAQEFSLGGDAELCSGNSIGLEPSPENVIGYQWSTSEQTPEILITESGSYWVEAVNNNNCILRDTAIITIIGVAPQIIFSAEGLCEDGTTIFEATLLTAGMASSWNWSFGDGQIGSGSTIAHSYDVFGDFTVQLSVTTTDGCSNFLEHPVHVFQKPTPAFTVDQQCLNLPLMFIENSTPGEAVIVSYNWTINGVFYSGSAAITSFAEPGFYPVLLDVTDANNCVVGLTGFVEVKPVPEIDFSVIENCEGSLTQFYENIDEDAVGGVSMYNWNFGDNTGSVLPNPTHYFAVPGIFNVTLGANGVNGCVVDSTFELTIFQKPEPDFVINNACLGATYQFNENSESHPQDSIVVWNWLVDDVTTFNTQNPSYVFNQIGLVPVELQVVTQNGCMNTVTQQIPVWSSPIASFTYSPEIGEAPFEVQFVLTTPDATAAYWYFGDTQESDLLNPTHVFTLNGTAYTQVVVTNDAGCSDTTGNIITIATPIYDIALRDIQWIATDGVADMKATITNSGNIAVNQILLTWQIGNDAPVMEEWTGSLSPGETLLYHFFSRPNFAGSQFPYICIAAETSPLTYSEVNLTDNQICRPTASAGLEVFPPYPNPGDDRMFIRFITPVEGDLIITAFDAKGNTVIEIEDDGVPKGFHQYFVDISALTNGNYKLLLQMGDYKGVVSFMKKKQ